jgi:hypothetical protein
VARDEFIDHVEFRGGDSVHLDDAAILDHQ